MKSTYSAVTLSVVAAAALLTACGGGSKSGGGSAPSRHVAFVTSVSGNGNLSSWADAGGKTGLEAADTICQTRATAAGLSGTFKAWLSDSNHDAYCRVAGFNGKKATNCGQASLPTTAGPWMRRDGTPLAATIDQLVDPNYRMYTPVIYNELGTVAAPSGTLVSYFTATEGDGTLDPGSPGACANWTSTTGSITGGTTIGVGYSFSQSTGTTCGANFRLLCLQTGGGPALPTVSNTGKKVFVTSVTGTGDLGSWADAGGNTGIAAADAVCQARAGAASLTGTYKAWISDSSVDAIDRIVSDGPWVRIDGYQVADNKAALSTDALRTAINLTETGVYLGDASRAWTGTTQTGVKHALRCNDWTSPSNAVQGRAGVIDWSSTGWTGWNDWPCDQAERLYCLQD